jgi:four helix bundle protein
MKENIVLMKSFKFAVRIVKLHLHLSKRLKEFELSAQVLRSGTSIGANIEEALGGVSRKDFANKLAVSYKEARETKYWIRLLHESGLIEKTLSVSLLGDCEELLKLLFTILQKTRTT